MSAAVILVKMIAAHLLGDFMFQSNKMCAGKLSAKTYERYMLISIHAVIQAALTYIFIGQWSNWLVPSAIFISHFIVDWIKTQSRRTDLLSFMMDQLAHFVVIIMLWWLVFSKTKYDSHDDLLPESAWLIATAYIAVLTPTSILIRLFMQYKNWVPDELASQGLPSAGKWIGYLERILILTFIFTSNIEGVGFLLAAKSVFRFGELNKARDIRITEYVLIGTFASFTIAILLGFGIDMLLHIPHLQ